MVETTAAAAGSRYFPETGCTVEGAFLEFFNHYGVEICGLPLTERLVENGAPTQYFQCLALAEDVRGQVIVKALGSEVLARRAGQPVAVGGGGDTPLAAPPFPLTSAVAWLPRHASLRYETRPLSQITRLVIHHSGVPAEVGVEAIAGYHVADLNWPGIGYHFVVYPDGHVVQTNGLTTISYHARQFNPTGVGIALLGAFDAAPPPSDQLDAAAVVCAWLRQALGLPLDAIQGHRELVSVTCPGNQWLTGAAWKYDLLFRVQQRLGELPAFAPAAPLAVAAAHHENHTIMETPPAPPSMANAEDETTPLDNRAPASPAEAEWRSSDDEVTVTLDGATMVEADDVSLPRLPPADADDVDFAAPASPERPA